MATDSSNGGDESSTGGTDIRIAESVYRLVPPDDAPRGAGELHTEMGGPQVAGSFPLIEHPPPYYTGPRLMWDQNLPVRSAT